MKKIFFIFFVLTLFFASCGKIEEYPDVPQITGINYTITDTVDVLDNHIKRLTLELSIIDGDGDIGLNLGDTVPPRDTSKVYIFQYNMVNGEYVPEVIEAPRFYRIPFCQPQGQNKTLKCVIKVDMMYPVIDYTNDTLRFDCFIVDRAWHKSNTISSPQIVIEK